MLWKKEKCKCKNNIKIRLKVHDAVQKQKSIIIIQKNIRLWKQKINNLGPIQYKNYNISYNCINEFENKKRSKNDNNNKKRENIIGCIINKKIPTEYYKYSLKWTNLKKELDLYIKKLGEKKNIKNIYNVDCIHKAGRRHHYDFKIIINNSEEFNVEFKYNALGLNDVPQFVSPIKPSQYINKILESWYYENYLIKIAKYGNLKMPLKEEYCKKIHNNKVKCMKEYKKKYDEDSNFNRFCKKIDKQAIKEFIKLSEINNEKLSEYLLKSQENKHYMCYNKKKIKYDTINKKMYKITKLIKKENTNYIYQTESGMKLEIKLRFKNGCGLQFPAFQIKRKIPKIKNLKKLCKEHNINNVPKLKKDICNILNKNNVIY